MSRYHDILGVSPGASEEEIKAAFRRRALECHPDRAEDGQKEAAQNEFVRVREAFEMLTNGHEGATEREEDSSDTEGKRPRRARRTYREEWRDHRNKKVHIRRDIIERVGGLSTEYDTIQEKKSVTVPVCSVLGGLLFLYDPLAMYGTGIWIVDLLLSVLIGSVYGFLLGSIWGFLDLFISDLVSD